MKQSFPHAFWFAIFALVSLPAIGAVACPFCDAPSQTLGEEIQSADAVVLAKLVKEAPKLPENATEAASDPNAGMATFKIEEVLRGQETVGAVKEIQVVFFGDSDRERVYLVNALGGEKLDWTTPLPLTPAGIEYVRKLPTLPASGVERIKFFQDYLEHEVPLLAQDAYDEYARAPYADLQQMKPLMPHDKFVKWVEDREISPSRRRLYLTLLGICGTKDDLPMLESMIVSDYTKMEPQLKAAVHNGLAAGGPVALPL